MNQFAATYQKAVKESLKSKWEKLFLFQCKHFDLPAPVVQFRFHPVRLWKLDFAWPDQKVAVEIDGGIWMKGGGGHSHPIHIERDMEKGNALSEAGYRLFRYNDKELRAGTAIAQIQRVLKGVTRNENDPIESLGLRTDPLALLRQ